MTNNSKILVTGGAGYIGTQTNIALTNEGYETVVFDSLRYGSQQVFIPEGSELFVGNLLNINELRTVFSQHQFSAVVHFAALLEVGESMKNPEIFYQTNVVGTLNLLQVMREFDVKNIIFSSTAAVYGIPEVVPISEDSPKNPINTYGYTKLMMETMMDDYHRAYNLNSIRLRYFNACGADPSLRTGEFHEPETHLIPLILQTALQLRHSITVFGTDYETADGTCIRDYIHTLDLASAHVKAVQKLISSTQPICEAINLGTQNGLSVKEILDEAKRVTNRPITVEYGARRSGDPAVLIADVKKAKQFLNWEATHSSAAEILETAWNWHVQQVEKNK